MFWATSGCARRRRRWEGGKVAREKKDNSKHDKVRLTREHQNDDDAFLLYERSAMQ
jgi:hypothetical protein